MYFYRLLLLCLLLLPFYSQAGGFIIVSSDQHGNPVEFVPGQPNPQLFPLETKSTKVAVSITGQSATTEIDQVFFNPSGRQLEGYFLFPVPKDVVIDRFTMFINGKETKAELLDAQKARRIYEEIVRRVKDPALLEYYNRDLFRVRIFPILPRSEQRIKLSYSETLPQEDRTVEYIFPLNTEKYAAKSVGELSFKVDIEGLEPLKAVYSPTHEVEIIRKSPKKATVGYERSDSRSEHDFKLYYSVDQQKMGLSMLQYKADKEAGYFFMNISPGFSEQKPLPKDIVFVLDKSGSMAGQKMEQAKKALQLCIANLNKEDRFELLPFSTEAQSLFGEVRPNTAENRQEASDFIDELSPIGGTNIEEALQLALAAKKKDERPFFIVFITDGKPTIGETSENKLLEKVNKMNSSNTRIFSFGIGTELNTHLLDKLTTNTNAYRSYALPEEDIEIKLSNFYNKISSPILTDVALEFDRSLRVTELYPKKLPDLFKGSIISLMGRYNGDAKGKVILTGKMNSEEQRLVYELNFPKKAEKHDFVADLWASRAVGYLLEQIRLHGEKEELKEEVVRLAKKHGIITPYTSYLILEDERQPIVGRPQPRPENQLLAPRVLNAPEQVEESLNSEVSRRKATSGSSAVNASKQHQDMSKNTNITTMSTRDASMSYQKESGETSNLADDIVNRQGRALYFNSGQWVDAQLQSEEVKNTRRIAFGSKEYFELLEKEKSVNELLALGRNVRFVHNNTLFEIHD